MRAYVLPFLAAFLSGCAIDGMPPSAASSPMVHSAEELGVAVSIARGFHEGRPAISVTIANNSQRPICIPVDTIENPDSYEMYIELRDPEGRAIAHVPSGVIVPPEPGITQIEPGESVQGSYNVVGRFKLPKGKKGLAAGTRARVTFDYANCIVLNRLTMQSGWQAI
jgi:hypothetical protein